MKPNSILVLTPSFNSYSSDQFAKIAETVIREIELEQDQDAREEMEGYEISDIAGVSGSAAAASEVGEDAGAEESEDDFEFAFVSQDPEASPITADGLFSDGQIRPIYPIFNRDLLLEDGGDDRSIARVASIRLSLQKLLKEGREPISFSLESSQSEIPVDTYCVWTPRSAPPPPPGHCKKSNSTGSYKKWRFRDLLHRSSSDGRETPTVVFLSTSATGKGEKEGNAEKVCKEKNKTSYSSSPGRGKALSPHEMHYVTNRAMREEERHRSYLPYRKDIVGFFTRAHGLGKGH